MEADRFARVVRVIEGEIIPRLLISSIALNGASTTLERATLPRHKDVAELARLLLSDNCWLASAFIRAVRRNGVPLDRICLELLAPAAREMRELWERKECDIAQFAEGAVRLLNVLQFVTESVP